MMSAIGVRMRLRIVLVALCFLSSSACFAFQSDKQEEVIESSNCFPGLSIEKDWLVAKRIALPQASNLDARISAYKKAIDLYRYDWVFWAEKARLENRAGRYDDAFSSASSCIELAERSKIEEASLKGKLSFCHFIRGVHFRRQSELEKAEFEFKKSLSLQYSYQALLNLKVCAEQQGKVKEATELSDLAKRATQDSNDFFQTMHYMKWW